MQAQQSYLAELIGTYPEMTAILVLIVGVIAARLVRAGVGRALVLLDERVARYSVSESAVVSPGLIRFSKLCSFWLVVALSVFVALLLLDVEQLSLAIDGSFAFIGRLLVGLAIVGIGHFLGLLGRGLVEQFSEASQTGGLAGRIIHGAVLLVAIVMGLGHLEIDTSFVSDLLLVAIAVVFGAVSLAFALGARQHVANLLAHGEIAKFAVGERIRIGDTQGSIVNVSSTGIDIATSEGIVSVPGAYFARLEVVRIVDGEAMAGRSD